MTDIYQRLRNKLHDLATGFPASESGVEIRLLKKLFSEKDAALYLRLPPLLQTPEEVAKAHHLDLEKTADHMADMAKRGLLFRVTRDHIVKYTVAPYVVGIYEFQLNSVDEELAADMEEYYESVFGKTIQSFSTPVMRTIPINREIALKWPVAPYEDVVRILEDQKKIAVAPCICRKTAKLAGKGCDKPMEACMLFGSHADYYVENGMGRYIELDEAKRIAAANDEAGLVMQPFNSQKVGGMCSCCGDCCGILRSLKQQPSPAGAVQSNYLAKVDEALCSGCETCIDRCQMEAIDMVEGTAVVNPDRCIGCGLCVTTCPTEAVELLKKPEDRQYLPPKTGAETYIRIAMERGVNPIEKQY